MALALRVEQSEAVPASGVRTAIRLMIPDFTIGGPRPRRDTLGEFLEEMMDLSAGGMMQLRHVHHCYDKLASERGWPELTPRILSRELCARGCQKIVIDKRTATQEDRKHRFAGVKRPTMIVFPEQL